MVHVLGIRHHGPGSTKRMLRALKDLSPDLIMIEMPVDASGAISYVNTNQLAPPVALLVYHPKETKQAFYYPFTHFSPEWQAMVYGLKNNIPIEFMDLPAGLKIDKSEIERRVGYPNIKVGEEIENQKAVKDPLGLMAQIAGYNDGERWWEVQFENLDDHLQVFTVIQEMIRALRKEIGDREDPINFLREAHMRTTIRKQIKAGFKRIVIVCGAWHGPALEDWQSYPVKDDRVLLKGFKKQKMSVTWVPWSYDQLAPEHGYGAGIISPAWYDLLYSHQQTAIPRWVIKSARLLRQKSFSVSTASVIEATRLVGTLASLREKQIPGIEELEDAIITTFCRGKAKYLKLVRQKLVIGDKIGKIGPDIPKLPLVADLEKCIKSARLSQEWETTDSIQKDLDLRKTSNLQASHLLHRLQILNIKWGKLRKGSPYKLGSFSEHWTLKRRTDQAIKIVAAARWGNTVFAATESFLKERTKNEKQISAITQMIDQALKANLVDCIPVLVQQLQLLTAQSKDLLELVEALPGLVKISRYGNTRQTDIASILTILNQVIPRVCIGVTNLSSDIDDELAKKLFHYVIAINQSIDLLNDPEFSPQWLRALQSLALVPTVHPMIRGFTNRLLFDKGVFTIGETSIQLNYSLSGGQNTDKKILWIEGFLHGSGLLLIYNPTLWELIDQWVDQLTYTDFRSTLPMLRRAFANFSPSERQEMLNLVKTGKTQTPDISNSNKIPLTFEQEKAALNIIHQILK